MAVVIIGNTHRWGIPDIPRTHGRWVVVGLLWVGSRLIIASIAGATCPT